MHVLCIDWHAGSGRLQISLRQSLFRTLLGGIFIASLLIVAGVWKSANNLVKQNISQDIAVTEKVLHRLIEDRQAIIKSVSNVLLRSYDFRQAVGTSDLPSIQTALESYASRINSDVIALVNLDHTIVASHSALFKPGETSEASTALAAKGYENGFFLIDGSLIQLNLYKVEIPTLRYYMIIGVEFDETLLQELRNLVDAEIIITNMSDNTPIASTLSPEQVESVLTSEPTPSWVDVTFKQKNTYISREVSLVSVSELPVRITIAVDVSEAFQAFTKIQISILVLTLIAVLVALGFSMLLARNVSSSVSNLVKAVNRVAGGEYGATLDKPSNLREISDLATAVDSMQESIQHREKHIRYQAQHDVLTGLFNRNYVEGYFDGKMSENENLQVVAITTIGFRTTNDLYGYSNGDNTLTVSYTHLTLPTKRIV